ncbi:MAG: hypothetical protein KDB86_11280 [Actinobacteria bacterium]|nr:hypothetical protein [Actinomycetota bacterium]MCB9388178.1 hypothetical protein [Acidimicrobiia bacterium]
MAASTATTIGITVGTSFQRGLLYTDAKTAAHMNPSRIKLKVFQRIIVLRESTTPVRERADADTPGFDHITSGQDRTTNLRAEQI